VILLLIVGCRPAVGVTRVDQEEWFASARRSVLSSDDVSEFTRGILRRRDLLGDYRQDPPAVIALLIDEIRETRSRELAVAIAELGYLQTKRVTAMDRMALGTALRFSYAYLFDPRLEPEAEPFDAQFRRACDLYNTALADLLRGLPPENLRNDFRGPLHWYGGSAILTVATHEYVWELEHFQRLRVTRDYRVANLPAPEVRRGFGVPVGLRSRWDRESAIKGAAPKEQRYLPPFLTVAGTVVLRFPDGASVLDDGEASCVVEFLDPTSVSSITIEGRRVPIEVDYTTPLAATLARQPQSHGIAAFRKAEIYAAKGGLYAFRPHRRGRIPVLLVHGLASDPYTWLPLYNDLLANETIRRRCEFIFWFYPTGQPILQSAAQLRSALLEARILLDPEQTDVASNWAVICGHSMGGILARTMLVDSGDTLWNAAFAKSIDDADLDPRDEQLLRSAFFFEALPGFRRAIFYAAPHRGSPRAESTLGSIANAFIQIPRSVSDPARRIGRSAQPKFGLKSLTSVKSLRANNPVLLAAADLPIDSRVTYHSIIGDEMRAGATDGTDGFVPYWSAHLDGAASEIVIKSGHSVQQTPRAARETRRILLEHIAAFDVTQAEAQAAAAAQDARGSPR